MTISIYDASIPQFTLHLSNLDAVLDKAVAHAEVRKIDPSVLFNARLFPDMLPLVRQVQIASDTAKGLAARLAAQDPPVFEDTEKTFPELKARIQKTIAFLDTIDAAKLEGSEQRQVKLKIGPNELAFTGLEFLRNFAQPNFFFHVTTVYAILRHNGVELGKRDFLGRK
jgi:hypothetical protein